MSKQTAQWIAKRSASLSHTLRARSKTLAERLDERTLKTPGCWLWQGGTSGGYGLITDRIGSGKNALTHRLAWELAYGPIPRGLCVLHSCDVRNCVYPEHLFLGTKGDNNRDCIRKGRAGFLHSNPMSRPESRLKVSLALQGKRKSPEHVAKMRRANIGKTMSPYTRAKISEALTGRARSPELMERIAAQRRGKPGKPHTLAARMKMSLSRQNQVGHPHTEESKSKMRAAWDRRRARGLQIIP